MFTRRAITVVLGLITALTFAFGFGNVWALGRALGVPAFVAPLVGPAVDLSVAGLLVGIRHLSMAGVPREQLRPARVLLTAWEGPAASITRTVPRTEPFTTAGPRRMPVANTVGMVPAAVAAARAPDSFQAVPGGTTAGEGRPWLRPAGSCARGAHVSVLRFPRGGPEQAHQLPGQLVPGGGGAPSRILLITSEEVNAKNVSASSSGVTSRRRSPARWRAAR